MMSDTDTNTIDEARQHKAELESTIAKILANFEQDTGLSVTSIDYGYQSTHTGRARKVKLHVKMI